MMDQACVDVGDDLLRQMVMRHGPCACRLGSRQIAEAVITALAIPGPDLGRVHGKLLLRKALGGWEGTTLVAGRLALS